MTDRLKQAHGDLLRQTALQKEILYSLVLVFFPPFHSRITLVNHSV